MKAIKDEFPNPVLAVGRDDYIDSCSFRTVFDENEIIVDSENIVIPTKYSLVCNGLQALIDSGDAVVVISVKSSAASYSKLFKFPAGVTEMSISVPKFSVVTKMDIVGSVIAAHNIDKFRCDGEFNDLYFGTATFEIRKGDILATEDSRSVYVDDTELEKPISSIFEISRHDDQESDVVPNFEDEKIQIFLKNELYARIQSRLYQITDEAPPELRIATTSFQIGNGLEQQIEQYLSDFPKTKLVIIDTFQKVRDSKSTGGKNGMYAGDYDDVSALKNISDNYGIAVMVVHHVRKLKDVSDPFNEVSGSTGITGAADTNFVLKRSRANETGTLLATGRDIAYQELTLKFDNRSHLWELVERKDMEDIHREEIPKFIFRLVDYISEVKEWRGTATQLITQVNETEVTPNVVTKMLARFYSEVFQPQCIEYKTKRTGTSRLIYLKKNDGNDGDDNKSAI